MGKFSRDKGARVERQLRDELIRHGWTDVARVPLSGAVKTRDAYQNDVVGRPPGTQDEISFECKARATGFDAIYKMLPRETSVIAFTENGSTLCTVSLHPNIAIADHVFVNVSEFSAEYQKAMRSVVKKCNDWIGQAQVLALKNDRKPFIYIRFRK